MKAKTYAVDPEATWPLVEKMLYGLAWKYVQKYPKLTLEEAQSECHVSFMKWCEKYSPAHGCKFSSRVYQSANYRLMSLVMKNTQHAGRFPELELDEESIGLEAPAVNRDLMDLVHQLPEDARQIAEMLLDVPEELLGVAMTPRQLLKRVKEVLTRQHGKTRAQVDEACAVLRERLTKEWAS